MEALITHLRTFGLTDKQARSYVALLELGQATAYQVAEKAKLKRPITYVVLDELRRKGLALKIPHSKKQLFTAKPPEEFFTEQEEKMRYAKRVLPELLALVQDKRKVRVLYFEGKYGIQEALEYHLPQIARKELLALYGKGSGNGSIPPLYLNYNQTLSDQQTSVRGFAPKHSSLKKFRMLDEQYGWKIVSLDESEFSSQVSVEIADDFVRVLLYKDQQAVIVDNPDFAKMMREVFEMIWKQKNKPSRGLEK